MLKYFGTALALIICILSTHELRAEERLHLSEMVVATKKALFEVQEDWESTQLSMSKVVLSVQAIASTDASGNVSFGLVEIGGDYETDLASHMVLTLAPPDPDDGSDVSSDALAEALAASILGAVEPIELASRGRPQLRAVEYRAEIRFGVKQTASGGFGFVWSALGLGAEAEMSEEHVQKITVVFRRLQNDQ